MGYNKFFFEFEATCNEVQTRCDLIRFGSDRLDHYHTRPVTLAMASPQTPKRPRAETMTRLSPAHVRARVDEPETEFTLFEVSEDPPTIEESALDDQTSNFDDSDYDLPALTPSPTTSEAESGEESDTEPSVTSTPHVGSVDTAPEGNWRGSRKSTNNYRLPRTKENLTGPLTEPNELTAVKLSNNQKQTMRKFCDYLTRHWPSKRLESELAQSRHTAFVDPTAFWYALLKTEFKRYIGFLEAKPIGNRSQQVIYLYISISVPKLKY